MNAKTSNAIGSAAERCLRSLAGKQTKTHLLTAGLLGAAVLLAASGRASVIDVGNPYIPTGADFTITALQGIDASNPLGASGFSPQVNNNFEFTPSIGVAYDQGGGNLKDFGLGLYSTGGGGGKKGGAGPLESTGLDIQYNQSVTASSVSFTVEDFDIGSKDTAFKSGKVEPSLLLLGVNGSVYASFTPQQIFPALTPTTGNANDDIWKVNIGQLLTTSHISDAAISGFVLYADATGGEQASDPYLLVSVGPGGMSPVPEANAGVVLAPLLGLFLLFPVRRMLRGAKADQETLLLAGI
jgi:hypothetical protein